jgi:hypothetical protein
MMDKLTIVEGNFALVPGGNCTQKWVVDDGSITGTVYQRVTGAATVTSDGIVIDVYQTREAAEQAIDPKIQAARELAKIRSGAEWS